MKRFTFILIDFLLKDVNISMMDRDNILKKNQLQVEGQIGICTQYTRSQVEAALSDREAAEHFSAFAFRKGHFGHLALCHHSPGRGSFFF